MTPQRAGGSENHPAPSPQTSSGGGSQRPCSSLGALKAELGPGRPWKVCCGDHVGTAWTSSHLSSHPRICPAPRRPRGRPTQPGRLPKVTCLGRGRGGLQPPFLGQHPGPFPPPHTPSLAALPGRPRGGRGQAVRGAGLCQRQKGSPGLPPGLSLLKDLVHINLRLDQMIRFTCCPQKHWASELVKQ